MSTKLEVKMDWEETYREMYGEVFSETFGKYLTSYKTNPVSEEQFTYFFRWVVSEMRSQFGEWTAHEMVDTGLQKENYVTTLDSSWRVILDDLDPQYSQVCDLPDCDQILHKNISIFIWENESTGEDVAVCESCNGEMDFDKSSWRDKGWVEQGDDDE